jgi:hypothetical protein
MSVQTLTRSFAGGEITPEALGRLDLVKYQTGLALCENFETLPHGPLRNRAGTEFIAGVKDPTKKTIGIPFIYNSEQAYMLELGEFYLRIHTEGGTVYPSPADNPIWYGSTTYVVGDIRRNGGLYYYCLVSHTSTAVYGGFDTDLAAGKWFRMTAGLELPTPYAEAALFDLHYTQSGDILTIVHPSYPPRHIQWHSATVWTISQASFQPTLETPAAPGCTPSGSGTEVNKYVTAAVGYDGTEESFASPATTVTGVALSVAGAYNTITPWGVFGAVRHNIYKLSSGLYGYVGQTDTLSAFKDQNVTPDVSRTPPESYFNLTGGNYAPGAVGYFQGRRWFAGSALFPQNLWATRSGTEANTTRSIPSRDDDAIEVRLSARQASRIRHIVPLSDLLLLTSEAEWSLTSQNSDVITPSTVAFKPQGYSGASNVQPVVTGQSVVYASDRGGRLREMLYAWESAGYKSADISILAPHLVDGHTIKQLAFTRSPTPAVWAVRDDGVLLGVTYVPEHQVLAWHQHTTDGAFESVCAIPEDGQDTLYFVVRRTIGGVTKRYIERQRVRMFSTLADAYFVDCGLTYTLTPADYPEGVYPSTISGLDHLEGKTVVALSDGAVIRDLVVNAGSVTLPHAPAKAHIGLPYAARAQTLPLALEAQAFGQGLRKNLNKVYLRVNESSAIKAGAAFTKLREYRQRTTEPLGSPPGLVTGRVEIGLTPQWSDDGHLCIVQDDPLPLTLLSATLEASVG